MLISGRVFWSLAYREQLQNTRPFVISRTSLNRGSTVSVFKIKLITSLREPRRGLLGIVTTARSQIFCSTGSVWKLSESGNLKTEFEESISIIDLIALLQKTEKKELGYKIISLNLYSRPRRSDRKRTISPSFFKTVVNLNFIDVKYIPVSFARW